MNVSIARRDRPVAGFVFDYLKIEMQDCCEVLRQSLGRVYASDFSRIKCSSNDRWLFDLPIKFVERAGP